MPELRNRKITVARHVWKQLGGPDLTGLRLQLSPRCCRLPEPLHPQARITRELCHGWVQLAGKYTKKFEVLAKVASSPARGVATPRGVAVGVGIRGKEVSSSRQCFLDFQQVFLCQYSA